MEYRIDLVSDRHGRDEMFHSDRFIGKSRGEPIFAAARILLAEGASPDSIIQTWRGETLCLSGRIGDMAKLTIWENKHGNRTFQMAKFVPREHMRREQGREIMDDDVPRYVGTAKLDF